jgi:hypothetical protein
MNVIWVDPQMFLDFQEMPTEVFNCEYFDALKKEFHEGTPSDKLRIRLALSNLRDGEKIIQWLERPIKVGGDRNILTMEKFNE